MTPTNDTKNDTDEYVAEIYKGLALTSKIWIYGGIPALVIGTVGNLLTIAVLLRAESFRSMSFGLLLIFLSLVDIGVLNTELLRYILIGLSEGANDPQIISDAGCRAFEFFRRVFIYLSAWTLVLVTIERLLSLVFHLRAMRLCNRKCAVMSWICVILCVVGVNLFHPIKGMHFGVALDGTFACKTRDNQTHAYKVYPWVDLCLSSLIPGIIILVMNVIVVCHIRRVRLERLQMVRDCGSARDSGMTRMLIAISVLFLLLTLPANSVLTVLATRDWKPPKEWVVPTEIAYKVAVFLTVLNSACNFMVYCVAGAKFRAELVLCLRCSRRQPQAPEINGIEMTKFRSQSPDRLRRTSLHNVYDRNISFKKRDLVAT